MNKKRILSATAVAVVGIGAAVLLMDDHAVGSSTANINRESPALMSGAAKPQGGNAHQLASLAEPVPAIIHSNAAAAKSVDAVATIEPLPRADAARFDQWSQLPPPADDYSPPSPVATALFSAPGAVSSGGQVFVRARGEQQVQLTDANAAADLVLAGLQQASGLNDSTDLELENSRRDQRGYTYYRLGQRHQGLPVFARQVVVQTDQQNRLRQVAGEIETSVDIATEARLAPEPALDIAFSELEETLVGAPEPLTVSELGVYIDEQRGAVLSYRQVVEYTTKESGYRVDEIYTDASDGSLVDLLPRIHSALNRKLYSAENQCLTQFNSNTLLPGNPVAADADEHSGSAYNHAAATYWFYKHKFGRDSFDDKGIVISATLHTLFQQSGSNCGGDNAMFLPDKNLLVFGEGGTFLKNPAGALDIFAHEMTHGVTAHESNLTYRDESGAINEALSDIFGAAAEAWSASGGSEAGNPTNGIEMDADSWVMGEDAATGNEFKRFMNNPTSDGRSKDDYQSRYTGSNDNGGVHTNSGIMNLAFYLLVSGGSHPNQDVSTTAVTGIGIDQALDIYYGTMTTTFTSSTSFEGARKRLAGWAEDEYGTCSTQWNAVNQSFDAVRVPGDWTPCSDDGGSSGDGGDAGDSGDTGDTGDTGDGGNDGDSGTASGSLTIVSAQSSADYNSTYSSDALFDGDSNTPWVSSTIRNPGAEQWVFVSLDQEQQVKTVDIDWNGYDFPRRFTIYGWQQGRWNALYQGSKSQPGTDSIALNKQTGHLLVVMSWGQYGRWYAINEITVK